jgi:ribosome-binding protein aMBF1 (putative translation factor)
MALSSPPVHSAARKRRASRSNGKGAGPPSDVRRLCFAYALRTALDINELTGAQLARALGRSPNTIARWLRGETLPSVLDVKPLSDVLNVEDQRLFTEPPDIPNYPVARYLKSTLALHGLARAVVAVSSESD